MKAIRKIGRLSPLECDICRHNDVCIFGQARDSLYRAGAGIEFDGCANYNGGKVYSESPTEQKDGE